MKILFDQGTPAPLRRHLPGHTVQTAYECSWSELENGELLQAAEDRSFDVLVTTDRNLKYQQQLAGRRVAIVVLMSTSWPRIQSRIAEIQGVITPSSQASTWNNRSRGEARNVMEQRLHVSIAGLGFILYSEPAAAHIEAGTDYLESDFWEPEDVARHVMDCQLTAFCTGSPGDYVIDFSDAHYDGEMVNDQVEVTIRLGLQVHDGKICVRDLYDLMDWEPDCPDSQKAEFPNGWYRLTVSTSLPKDGADQVIRIYVEQWPEKPTLKWPGVPSLIPGDYDTDNDDA